MTKLRSILKMALDRLDESQENRRLAQECAEGGSPGFNEYMENADKARAQFLDALCEALDEMRRAK